MRMNTSNWKCADCGNIYPSEDVANKSEYDYLQSDGMWYPNDWDNLGRSYTCAGCWGWLVDVDSHTVILRPGVDAQDVQDLIHTLLNAGNLREADRYRPENQRYARGIGASIGGDDTWS